VNRYDEVPYSFHAFAQTHPDRLTLVAKLFGISTKSIHACRVLELGCGRGGNILPLAEQLPGSEFIGVELSEVQANEAKSLASRAGLTNIDVRHMNILDVDDSMGKFDYIITHGVYSWVPKTVQDKILDICSHNLSDCGVAYVSYNVNPGWHMRGMLRDMMVYHASRFDTPKLRIQQARSVLDFVASNTSDKTPYGMFLKSEVNMLRNQGDEYLYHEHLSEVNDPIYFYQFAERCAAAGLQYLGESDIAGMFLGHFSDEIVSTVERVASDFIQMEQYLDFLRNRMFRQSLLTHSGLAIDRELKPINLHGLYLSTQLQPEENETNAQQPGVAFTRPGVNGKFMANHPFMVAALKMLSDASPGYLAYEQLLIEARRQLDKRTLVAREQYEMENAEWGRAILKLFVNGAVEFHTGPPRFSTSLGATPIASRLARLLAESGDTVTNLAHQTVRLSAFEAKVLQYLDGTNDRDMICRLSSDFFHSNFVATDGTNKEQRVQNAVDAAMLKICRLALIVSK
jgi:methyltransferase-like protein/2-polyprenyl-3-methyl-5-hydroxy-6-metoxy-1,4-benzoquinol methylase